LSYTPTARPSRGRDGKQGAYEECRGCEVKAKPGQTPHDGHGQDPAEPAPEAAALS
jgi:hypothetical protein